MGKYFGTDGFRGEANVDLTAEHAFKVGRFLGWYYGKKHSGTRAQIAIGKDTRRSSYMLEDALCAGICEGVVLGMNAIDCAFRGMEKADALLRNRQFHAS